jgi:hypothetical protein
MTPEQQIQIRLAALEEAHKSAYLLFDDARAFVRRLGLRSKKEWQIYCKSGNKPDAIPSAPNTVYKDAWCNWGDWLGTGNIANQLREYLPFEEARTFVHGLGIENQDAWAIYSKSGNRPNTIPSHPDKVYKDDWRNWGDWLHCYI